MKLTASLTLHPDPDMARMLVRTFERANAVAGWISREAWRMKRFDRNRLHHLVYHRVRERFGLSSRMAVQAGPKNVKVQRDVAAVELVEVVARGPFQVAIHHQWHRGDWTVAAREMRDVHTDGKSRT